LSQSAEFYIVDVRPEWSRKPYITVWRPNDAGYAFPLSWGGIYSKEHVDAHPRYYANKKGTKRYECFPVPREVVEALAIPKPAPRMIDGDVGPVVVNSAKTRAALRKARYLPPVTDEVQK
jgi:hypothetical protein